MILEGIVTTVSPEGGVNIAPMGPTVAADLAKFTLRPFPTSTTYQNLCSGGGGVLHVTDDVLLLARAAVGPVDPPPRMFPAKQVKGFVLADACRYYEFLVRAMDASEPRVRIEADVVHAGRIRDFFGFNRAKHAVIEAAILATRIHLIARSEVEMEFRRFEVIVGKTGGAREKEAFEFLNRWVTAQWQGSQAG